MSVRANIRSQPLVKPFRGHLTTVDGDKSREQTDARSGASSTTLRPPAWVTDERRAESAVWRLGDLTLTRTVLRAGQPAPLPQGPLHIPDRCCVLLLHSSHTTRTPSTLAVSTHSQLSAAALPWPVHHPGQDCDVLTLVMPITTPADEEPDTTARIRHLDTASGPGALFADFMRQLARQIGHIPEERRSLLADATRNLAAACTAQPAMRPEPASHRPGSGQVERTRIVVQQNMGSPDFGPQQLARLLAMSRSKLYRLLDGDGGVAHFINRERLTQAWRDLTAPGEAVSVHAIANQVGFRDHSTFSRAFRREYGFSPTEARERTLLVQPDAWPRVMALGAAPEAMTELPSDRQTAPDRPPLRARAPSRSARIDCETSPENGMNSPVLGF